MVRTNHNVASIQIKRRIVMDTYIMTHSDTGSQLPGRFNPCDCTRRPPPILCTFLTCARSGGADLSRLGRDRDVEPISIPLVEVARTLSDWTVARSSNTLSNVALITSKDGRSFGLADQQLFMSHCKFTGQCAVC